MIFRKNNKAYTDSHLMQLIMAGDQAAFSELYLRYKSRMYYYFYRMLGNSADQANDFLQELFMKLIERPESYRPEFNFSTWLYSIANNMCKNEYRRRSIRMEYQAERSPMTPFESVNEAGIEPEQVMEKVFQTLDLFGEEHRSAFLLHYREGFSVKEVAEILDLAEGTVKSRLFYARKLLAEKLNYLKDEIEF